MIVGEIRARIYTYADEVATGEKETLDRRAPPRYNEKEVRSSGMCKQAATSRIKARKECSYDADLT